jgi:hypothetical protein
VALALILPVASLPPRESLLSIEGMARQAFLGHHRTCGLHVTTDGNEFTSQFAPLLCADDLEEPVAAALSCHQDGNWRPPERKHFADSCNAC